MILKLYDRKEDVDSFCEIDFDGFRLLIDSKHKLEDYLNNPDIFYDQYIDSDIFIDNKKYTKSSLIDSIYRTRWVTINFKKINPSKFISENKFIKSKKILLEGKYTISDYEKIKQLLKQYGEYSNNVYVFLEGNSSSIKLKEAYDTIKKIKDLALYIDSHDFSPIEKIMYTYDIVRNRVYKFEDENESVYVSRNLTSVLNGDKIVCAGYARIFESLLKYMGINCSYVKIRQINSIKSHARWCILF